MQKRKVLIVGSGGREHALAVALAGSPSVGEVLVCPGNAGTRQGERMRNVAGDPARVAQEEAVDLVVVGPEAPLCAGLVDTLSRAGIPAYGPSQAAARLEASKGFMKDFAERFSIPTAAGRRVSTPAEAEAVIDSFERPPVVKADGLAGGKGVIVASTHAEAREAARNMLRGESFGEAGKSVVIEERLEGFEVSVHAICDSERYVLLPPAQDHKRVGEGDQGPNTGGMGTYAPTPLASGELMQRVERTILAPTLAGMRELGAPFRGTLFAGLMVSPEGEPRLLEYNVRFGDPETQVMLRVVDTDWGQLLYDAAAGRLQPELVKPMGLHSVCVVLAAAGYPGTPRKGDTISGLEAAERIAGVRVFHAGTASDGGRVVSAGGRVLGVSAVGSSLQEAHQRAYRGVEQIGFEGMHFRGDIAQRALQQ